MTDWKVLAEVVGILAGMLGKVRGDGHAAAFRSLYEALRVGMPERAVSD